MNSDPYSSDGAADTAVRAVQARMQGHWNIARRILAVATGYMLTSWITGWMLRRALDPGGLGLALLSGILVAAAVAPIAIRLQVSRLRQWIVWSACLFLNSLSIAIEGAFFVPTLSHVRSVPVMWIAFLLFQSLVTAGLITWSFGGQAERMMQPAPQQRTWYSWAWWFVLSSISYLLFYFIFGAANYALVTRPYYAAYVSGLAVPAPKIVLIAEMVRAPLLVLSIVPLILLWRGKRSLLGMLCGIVLFVLGGVVPLLLNADLPDVLRLASGVEIFFQNFLTGLVAVALLAPPPMDDAEKGIQV